LNPPNRGPIARGKRFGRAFRSFSLLRGLILALVGTSIGLGLSGCGGNNSSTYTIGGTVSGLVGTGLVLQNYGGNNLAISTNGSFTFTQGVNSGGPYSGKLPMRKGSQPQMSPALR